MFKTVNISSQNRLFEGLQKKTPPSSWPGRFLISPKFDFKIDEYVKYYYFKNGRVIFYKNQNFP